MLHKTPGRAYVPARFIWAKNRDDLDHFNGITASNELTPGCAENRVDFKPAEQRNEARYQNPCFIYSFTVTPSAA